MRPRVLAACRGSPRGAVRLTGIFYNSIRIGITGNAEESHAPLNRRTRTCSSPASGLITLSTPLGVLHSQGMKQRDLKNPSCRTSSEVRHEKNLQGSSIQGWCKGGGEFLRKRSFLQRIRIDRWLVLSNHLTNYYLKMRFHPHLSGVAWGLIAPSLGRKVNQNFRRNQLLE